MGWKYRKVALQAQRDLEDNNYEAAEAKYSEVLQADPELVDALLHRAYARLRLGKFDDALEDAKACVRLRPENGVGFMLQGEVLLGKKEFIQAHMALKKAVELEHDNGQAFYQLGRASLALGRRAEAADYFELALQFERDYVMAQWMADSMAGSFST